MPQGLSALLALALVAAALPARAATYVYVGCTDSNEIRVLKLDAGNGDLTAVETVRYPASSRPRARRRWR
jgi:6-phosphogluconolactonase